MNHIVITRVNFQDDTLFQEYFEIMKKYYIPSINSQTNKNFKIGLVINPKHIDLIKHLLDDNVIFFSTFEEVRNYCYTNNIEIQTRHDCDDWMREDYIETIQNLYTKNKDSFDKFIIHSKVFKLDHKTGEIYEHGLDYSKGNFTSMFLTLCQKEVTNFVYDKNHRFMNEITPNIFLLKDQNTRLVVHGKNSYSKINPQDKKIGKIIDYDLTIVTPTFDNIEYLSDFFLSIIKSKKKYNIEVLIGIDNCKKTKEYVSKRFNSLKNDFKFYFFDKSVGPYVIRNSLSKISNSKKILFVDSDDILHEDLITDTINALDSHDTFRFKFYNFKNNSDITNFKKENINNFLSIGQLGINKKILLDFKGFEPWVCSADSEFKMREEIKKVNTLLSNKILYYRRRHEKNLTKKKETDLNSSIRQKYFSIIRKRREEKKVDKITEMTITKFYQILSENELILKNEHCSLYPYDLEKPELSVIIPTYNNVDFIDDCLSSVEFSSLNQNVEILIGIDGCINTLEHFTKRAIGPNVKIFYFDENNGPYSIKNTLASISKSNKLIFFDSDDLMLKDMITYMNEKLDHFVCIKPRMLNFDNLTNTEIKGLNNYGEGVFGIQKDVFLNMNGFEPWMCAADSDFMGRLYKSNPKINFSKKPLFKRRIHSNSLTTNRDTGMRSVLRHHYFKIMKSKKGSGNPEILNTRNYTYFDSMIDYSFIENSFLEKKQNAINNINSVINKPVRKVVESHRPDKYNRVADRSITDRLLNKSRIVLPNQTKTDSINQNGEVLRKPSNEIPKPQAKNNKDYKSANFVIGNKFHR